MPNYSVPNGNRMIFFHIPDSVGVTVVRNRPVPLISDVGRAIREAILHPIACERLSKRVRHGQKVAIIVTDITRKLPEDMILPVLLDELQAGGVGRDDITVVVA
ncbi:MAG: nickel-dependent lactate racemase, partial [Syntrophales bacterium LBB04]|nr:nickel-dependent lactate racemase [Syntrophales bacterium LBB04]